MSTKALRSGWFHSKNVYKKNINTITKATESRLLASSSSQSKDKRSTQSTVDEADIHLFSQMKDWWNPNGPVKALHSMNLIRVPLVRDGLVECSDAERTCTPLKDKAILDVGCGGGILSEGLARIGAKVTGIDASKQLIDLALSHRNIDPRIANNKPEYYHTTIEEHASCYKNHYDGIVASEVIEHVNNKEVFVKSCVQALKPGGKIFFTTPNRTRISQIGTIYFAEYILNLTPIGTHQYEKFITPNELTFLLERNNCHVELIYGLMYHFLANRWEFIRSQSLMFALQAVKLNYFGVFESNGDGLDMSLTKLLKAPIKLFKKDVITFLIVRRYDLGRGCAEKLRYIAVKPSASISTLRQKVWHLLDLPDYCEEVIILKSAGDIEIPLTSLRRGNNPHHPYIMEVWPPGNHMQSKTTVHNNMLTMGKEDGCTLSEITPGGMFKENDGECQQKCHCNGSPPSTISNETMALNKRRILENKPTNNFIYSDYKKSDLSCRISSSTLFRLNGRKSRDNFTNILLKIQNDLSTLSNKLSDLENRISPSLK